ncbi:MAG: class I SAM-dependent methyltransferase [Acidimicrobiia bacterium]
MRGELNIDRRYLTEQQYANDANLAARQSIYSYQRPHIDLGGRSIDLAGLCGDERLLDVGCGNGAYLATLRARRHRGLICGADLSVGMLQCARRATNGPLVVCDAQALPFDDDAFDVTFAMHMLYHVPERALALDELRRVLRPDGVALVVTNFESHLAELDDLLVECATATVGVDKLGDRSSSHFKMDDGAAELEAAFDSVTAHPFLGELVLTDVAPVVSYARSMGAWVADTEHQLDPVISELQRRVAATIAADGAFRIRTAAGCFVCR